MKTWEVIRMYYSNGNYEAFARPEKPENVEVKSLSYWFRISISSAACFLIRDGQMDGSKSMF